VAAEIKNRSGTERKEERPLLEAVTCALVKEQQAEKTEVYSVVNCEYNKLAIELTSLNLSVVCTINLITYSSRRHFHATY
jgi:hypothetical protein